MFSFENITSVFATLNAILFAFNQKEGSFKSLFTLLLILEILLSIFKRRVHLRSEVVEKTLLHYEDHGCKLRKKVVPKLTSVVHHI